MGSVSLIDGHIDEIVSTPWWVNNEQLKTCPFCGSQSYLKERYHGNNEKYYVFCSGCYVETFEYDNVHAAVEAWNKRV